MASGIVESWLPPLSVVAGMFATMWLAILLRHREARDKAQVAEIRRSLNEVTQGLPALKQLELRTNQPTADSKKIENAVAAVRGRTDTNYQVLTEHYANALSQSRTYAYLSYVVGLLGFIVMLVGVGFVYTGSLNSGIVAAVVGTVVEGAAGLVFVQGRKANSDSQQNLQLLAETVREDNNREIAVHLASLINDPAERDRAIGDLARQAMSSATSRKGDPSPARPDSSPTPITDHQFGGELKPRIQPSG